MTITIPITNKLSLNKIYGGIHFTTRKKHKDEYREVCSYYAKPYEGEYPVKVTYHYKFKGRLLDSSNCAYLTKLIEDGLVQSGVFPDDGPKYIFSTENITDKGDNEVEVTIEPV